MPKPPTLTPAKRRKFLDALSETGDVSAAAKAAGLARGEALRLREEDETFRSAWDDAHESAVDALEAEARRRALEGDEEDIYYRGEIVGTKTRKSDGMLEFLLKAYRPQKFASKTASKAAHDRTVTVDDIATDPTVLTFRHKDPAGTLTAFIWGTDSELVRDSTGTFRVDLVLADSGRHHYRWEATGSAHGAEEASFDVRTSNVI